MHPSVNPIRIVIADDHPFFREGFKFMIKLQKSKEVEIIAEAGNGEELIDLVKKNKPDLVVTDIRMPVLNGIEASRLIKKIHPDIHVVALSMFEEENYIMDMLDAGAKGYLAKNADNEEVIQAIKTVHHGGHYFSNSTSQKLINLIAESKHNPYKKSKPVKFSQQELQIIKFICQQYTSKEIAQQLHLSVRTIEDHRHDIAEKIEAKNIVGIVLYALKYSIVHLSQLI